MKLPIVNLALVFLSLFGSHTAVQAQPYLIDWFSIDGGGGMNSAGGIYGLSGTIGQPDAGHMSGGSYTLDGGFWALIATVNAVATPCTFALSSDSACFGSSAGSTTVSIQASNGCGWTA